MNNKIRIGDLLNSDTIVVHLSATTKEAVLDELIEQLDKAGRLNDKDGMKQAILAREAQGSTGIGEGIAIPHAKTAAVKTPAIAYGFSKEGVEFDSLDQQKAHLFFMIAATEDANQAHLATLALLSQMLMDESFRQELMKAETKERVLEIITNKEKELESEDESVTEDVAADQQHVSAKVVAVTACPTGIAHTYMAADALKKKAAELGISLKVETNGSGGVKTS